MVTSYAISFDQVTFTINQTTLLENISGSFQAKEITCLIGPSGSGKTTLLKLCNGLISPNTGQITILDQTIQDIPPVQLRRSVGIALQHSPMIAGNVFRNISLPLRLRGQKMQLHDAEKLLTDVGLEGNLLQQEAKDLSGGQKQRVAIARTLANRPKILLLDEITASLDQEAAAEIEQLILHIQEKYGVTVVWITHDLHQAKRVGKSFWRLESGRLMGIGKIDSLPLEGDPT
jgi:putative ABC transport system ATP-binding protein